MTERKTDKIPVHEGKSDRSPAGQAAYGREPFDLRLTVLCLLRRLPAVIACTVLGTLVFGGGYYVRHVLLRGEKLYAASSTYRVEYAVQEEKDVGTVYINQMSWNTYVQSQLFLDAVRKHLEETVPESGHLEETFQEGGRLGQAAPWEGKGGALPQKEEIGGALEAFLASDLRVPSTRVTTASPEKSVWIARAVEAAMTQELAGELREIVSISVIDPADTAGEVIPDVRVGRAFALSAVLSCFFTVVILLLCITGEDRIRLPGTVWKRYGVRSAGTAGSRELAENIRYFFRAKPPLSASGEEISGEKTGEGSLLQNVAVCPVQEQIDPEEVLAELRGVCPEIGGEPGAGGGWFAVPSPLHSPGACARLREAEGILLVLGAWSHGGRQLEHTLEYLCQQDCPVTAVLLWDADELLIRWYYFCGART